MNLSDYAKSFSYVNEDVNIAKVSGDTDEDTVKQILEVSGGKWIARKLSDNHLYLFHDDHFIDVTELVYQMDQIYLVKGYQEYGYNKLSDVELIRYTAFKNIINSLIPQALSHKLDPKATAESIFEREIFYT